MNATVCRGKRDWAAIRARETLRRAPAWLCIRCAALSIVLTATAAPAEVGDAVPDRADTDSTTDVAQALRRSITLVERSSAEYLRQRECFSCHHQAAAVLMLREAQRRGFAIDENNLQAQLDRTAAHLRQGLENYRKGIGQGGRVDTAAWALWALDEGGRGGDETTTAVALETSKGEFAFGLALGIVLMTVALIVNLFLQRLQQG
jgi:hypothetical protein